MESATLEKIISDQALDFFAGSPGIARQVQYADHLRLDAVSIITGVRRCGKSTLLESIAELAKKNGEVHYLNLDDPRLRDFKAKDFETVYMLWAKSNASSTSKVFILLDELQNVEGWEQWVTFFARKKNHKVFITGSNSNLLSSELSTFLTGRHIDIHLTPLSLNELVSNSKAKYKGTATNTESRIEIEKIFEHYLKFGGFPRANLDSSTGYLPNYYDDIVNKDIIFRRKVKNKSALNNLAKILASETTRLFNHSKTARLLGLKDEATIRRYCSYFLDFFLYTELRCFSKSIRNQTRSLAKYYSVDHALAISNGLWKSEDLSRTLELIVCNELSRRKKNLFYWKSKKGYKVDFIVTKGVEPTSAIQVCYDMSNSETLEREVRALISANQELKVSDLQIITRYEQRVIKKGEMEIKVIPIIDWLLLSEN